MISIISMLFYCCVFINEMFLTAQNIIKNVIVIKQQSSNNHKSNYMKMTTILLIITAILTALIAGLFYAYSCSVVLGLGKLSDTEYLKAMQNINREILNPLFFSSFMGTTVLLPVSVFFVEKRTSCIYSSFMGRIGLFD